MTDQKYMSGFGNEFASEAVAGALPVGQNSPKKAPLGLYAEQLSGTSFLVPRKSNQRSWLYRIQPSVTHLPFEPVDFPKFKSAPFNETPPTPNQLRWKPLEIPTDPTDFLKGLATYCGNGDISALAGCAVHLYAFNQSMSNYFYNSDGDFLFVPQEGKIILRTEFGILEVEPGEIAVIQRGIKFQVTLPKKGGVRGYVCENYGPAFELPNLGPIGANGLANPRDFLTPIAEYQDERDDYELITKFHGKFWVAKIDHSPLDVVAWHGNYAPYKYDLSKFNTINTVSFDHPDPSIFTVLTSPSDTIGVSNIDFVIFPSRWVVADNTFRPPYYHRNVMSEFMGSIKGEYDAKPGAFLPGGASVHNRMAAHGPDAESFEKASNAEEKPVQYKDTLAIMFESRWSFSPTAWAMNAPTLERDYYKCWQDLKPQFKAK